MIAAGMRGQVALLALALCAAPCRALPLPKLALDTDIGSDFDDAWALTYLLARSRPDDPHREFDFALVQCSSFNTTKRALIAAKMLFDLGRFDVPIAVGLYTGENPMPQFPAVPADFTLATFVAAGGSVSFSPNGYHLMCMDSRPMLRPGATVPVTLRFQNGQKLTADFQVRTATGK
jgi:hypothetical protein